MKKTIVYIGNFKFPDKNAAGKRVLGNSLLLQSLGYQMICIGQGDGKSATLRGISSHTFFSRNVDRVLKNGANEVISILEQVRQDSPIQAVILYGAIFLHSDNLRIIRWCKARNIVVYYDHVDWLEIASSNILRTAVRFYNRMILTRAIFPLCDGVICISHNLSDYHQAKKRKTVIIPPLSIERHQAGTIRRRSKEIRFVYAGTAMDVARPVEQWKDRLDLMFEKLLEATERENVRQFQFDIYGLTEEEYIQMFPKKQREQGRNVLQKLYPNVVFHGKVSNETAMAAVKDADYSVLVRDRKRATMAGFPTKVSESISCGTPVICTDTSDLREYIHNGYNGFICEKDELADVFEKALKLTDEELESMKRNCCNNMFYYEKYRPQMEAFFNNDSSSDELCGEN